jgi:phosphate transport system substrate-binding protein
MRRILIALGLVGAVCSAHAQVLAGGSSAAEPVVRAWARAYQKQTGTAVDYKPLGAANALQMLANQKIGFAMTQSPVGSGASQALVSVPVLVSGVVPVTNVPHSAEHLRLTGPLLARIFLGEVTRWNAPELEQVNPGAALPNLPIKVVVRSDAAGATFNFTSYLSAVSPQWKSGRGAKAELAWPEGFVTVKGTDAVAKAVKETPGAIAFVSYDQAREHKLAMAALRNRDGEFVRPSLDSFGSALAESGWGSSETPAVNLIEQPGKRSWPITNAVYAVFPKVASEAEHTQAALKFMAWCLAEGDSIAEEANFVPVPDNVQAAVFRSISTIKSTSGSPIGVAALASAMAK